MHSRAMTARSARVAAGANSAGTTEASVRFPGFPCRRGDFGSAPIARRSETFWYDSAWFPDVGAIAPRAGGSIRFPRFCRIDPRDLSLGSGMPALRVQMFGAIKQIPHGGFRDQQAGRQRAARFSSQAPAQIGKTHKA
jgi:hypothetical protein